MKASEADVIEYIESQGDGKFTSDTLRGEAQLIIDKSSKLNSRQRGAVAQIVLINDQEKL